MTTQATTYSAGVRWAVKHNTVSSDNGRLPYWIASVDSEERAQKFYDEERKHAESNYPGQPDKLPEILKTEIVWTVQEPA